MYEGVGFWGEEEVFGEEWGVAETEFLVVSEAEADGDDHEDGGGEDGATGDADEESDHSGEDEDGVTDDARVSEDSVAVAAALGVGELEEAHDED